MEGGGGGGGGKDNMKLRRAIGEPAPTTLGLRTAQLRI